MQKKELTNMDIVLYVLYKLGGTTRKIFTEDITLECFRIVPSRFSWIIHPQYPDLEPVRKALFEARSSRHHNLVYGRHGKTNENQVSDGWLFSPSGIQWIKQNKDGIQSVLGLNKVKKLRTNIDKLIFSIKNSSAFRKFEKDNNCENILPYEFTDFLNASLDTPHSVLRDRLERIRTTAASAQENNIITFTESAEKYFSELLRK